MTLRSDPRFRPKNKFMLDQSKKMIMYHPEQAKRSEQDIRKVFDKVGWEKKEDIIKMLYKAGNIAARDAQNIKKFSKKERKNFLKVSHRYKILRIALSMIFKKKYGRKPNVNIYGGD